MMRLFKKKKERPIMKAEEISSADKLLYAGITKANIEINEDDLSVAKWVLVSEEEPKEEGFYFVLTNDHLTKGIAWYGPSDEDETKNVFDIWWATSGNPNNPPKAHYWLKDNHWGMVYKFKKGRGEI